MPHPFGHQDDLRVGHVRDHVVRQGPPGQLPAQRRQQRREDDDAVMTGAPRHDARDHGGAPGGGSAFRRASRRSVSKKNALPTAIRSPSATPAVTTVTPKKLRPISTRRFVNVPPSRRSDEQRRALGRIDDRRRGDDAQPARSAVIVSQPTAPGRILGERGGFDAKRNQRRCLVPASAGPVPWRGHRYSLARLGRSRRTSRARPRASASRSSA